MPHLQGWGLKSVKGCQTFLGRSHGAGVGSDGSVPLGVLVQWLCASGRRLSRVSRGVDSPGTAGMPRWPCQLSGEQMPSLQSGWEDVHGLVLEPTCWSAGRGGKRPLTVVWDHLWALKPGLALLGGRRALSTLPLGIYHQVQAAARAWLLISKKLVVLQSLTLPPLGGKFTCGKVPAHAGVMLRCNNGRPARFGDGGSPPGPGELLPSRRAPSAASPGSRLRRFLDMKMLLSQRARGCSAGQAGPQVGAGPWACL